MIWMRGLLVSIFLIALFLILLEARGGEVLDCAEKHGSGRWVYRIVDEKRCWFPAGSLRRGQEKPLEELRWPGLAQPTSPVAVDPEPPQAKPEPPKIRPEPTEFDRRFHGDIH
jgi:hypothetical protein